jgi:diphthamide biosynthesis methyltransferase
MQKTEELEALLETPKPKAQDIKETPAILLIPGELHFKEQEALEMFA